MSLNFIRHPASGHLTVVANGASYPVPRDHPNYERIIAAVKAGDVDTFISLTDIPKAVKAFSNSKVEVRDGVVYYEGEALHNGITDRILELMNEGFPFEPMCKFLENLMSNPSKRAVDELYMFLANQALPITEDGCFLAYKNVTAEYLDHHTKSFNNTPGQKLKMARNKVDDNKENHCSDGFHVGAISYAATFMSGGRVVICKVNPKDVVSIPSDHNCTKCRVCEYEVLSDYKGNLERPLYTPAGQESSPVLPVLPQHEAAVASGPAPRKAAGWADLEGEVDDEIDDDDEFPDDDDEEVDDDDDYGDDDDEEEDSALEPAAEDKPVPPPLPAKQVYSPHKGFWPWKSSDGSVK